MTSEQLIRLLHDAGSQAVLAITGGGTTAIGQLLSVPGGSRSLLSAAVPYSDAALREWLSGKSPEQNCSARTARLMAMAAFAQARRLQRATAASAQAVQSRQASATLPPVYGIGCTAALASEQPKRGEHRIHVAWQSAATTGTLSVTLRKGSRSRAQEEALAAAMVLSAMARAAEVNLADLDALENLGETIETVECRPPAAWQALLDDRKPPQAICLTEPPPQPRLVLPGAFNPWHAGHQGMAQYGSEKLGAPVDYELSVTNVDKPPLDFIEIEQRAAQFIGERLWLTSASRFTDKARLFPGATFLVGYDTLARIVDPRYYQHDTAERDAALATIAAQACRFLVFGRHTEQGFQTLDQLAIPAEFARLCQQVPEADFRNDISSTALRCAADD